jgi:hypothetical protein
MPRRPAATLMEVLVAIFIMGIGLLAILALFPLGALRMAQAIQDDRAGHLAYNGHALAQTFDLRNDASVTPLFIAPPGVVTPGNAPITAHPDWPGFPVFVDPVGTKTYVGANALYVGGQPGITRTDLATFANDPVAYLRWFTLTDDLQFDNTGVPSQPMQREGALSYALLFRRPRSSVPNVVEMSVVVYSRRPLSPGNDFSSYETTYPATFTPASNLVTIDSSGGAKPNLRPGSWILDGTVNQMTLNGTVYGYANGHFYRVVAVNEVAPDRFEVEVGSPLRGTWPGVNGAPTGTVVVMENVVEVLEKGPGW